MHDYSGAFKGYLCERFGFSERDFSGICFISDGKRVFAAGESACKTNLPLKTHSKGMVAGRIQRNGKIVKPTTNFIQLFGRKARKNVIEIGDDERDRFIRGEDIECGEKCADDGYVIVSWKGIPIGCGLLKGNILKSQIPKSKAINVQ